MLLLDLFTSQPLVEFSFWFFFCLFLSGLRLLHIPPSCDAIELQRRFFLLVSVILSCFFSTIAYSTDTLHPHLFCFKLYPLPLSWIGTFCFFPLVFLL